MRNRLTLDELGSEFCTKLSCSICFISSSCACSAAVVSAYLSSSLNAMRLSDTVHVTNNKHSCKHVSKVHLLPGCNASVIDNRRSIMLQKAFTSTQDAGKRNARSNALAPGQASLNDSILLLKCPCALINLLVQLDSAPMHICSQHKVGHLQHMQRLLAFGFHASNVICMALCMQPAVRSFTLCTTTDSLCHQHFTVKRVKAVDTCCTVCVSPTTLGMTNLHLLHKIAQPLL